VVAAKLPLFIFLLFKKNFARACIYEKKVVILRNFMNIASFWPDLRSEMGKKQ